MNYPKPNKEFFYSRGKPFSIFPLKELKTKFSHRQYSTVNGSSCLPVPKTSERSHVRNIPDEKPAANRGSHMVIRTLSDGIGSITIGKWLCDHVLTLF